MRALSTELGLIIDSPQMAQRLDGFADDGSWYQLRLSVDGQRVQWLRSNADGSETVFDVPPETSAWQRFELRLFGPPVPVRDL